jgi:VanZ family protein
VRRTVRLWGPVALWMAAIFHLSSLSRVDLAGRVPDWITHPVAYGAGGLLVCHALVEGRRPSVRDLAVAVLLTTGYGVTDEYHQSRVPGRDADPMDVVKDFVGAAAAALVYRRSTPGTVPGASEEAPR